MPSVLVYRDTIGVRSESFIQRQYKAFKELTPFYVGTKRGPLAPKDALILAKSDDPAWRRLWMRRIVDHDGTREGEGGLALWLRLAQGVGLPLRDRQPATGRSRAYPGGTFTRKRCASFAFRTHNQEL